MQMIYAIMYIEVSAKCRVPYAGMQMAHRGWLFADTKTWKGYKCGQLLRDYHG